MATAPITSLSVEEYLRLEEAAEFRSEYIDGQMIAMAGGTVNHSLIGSNLISELRDSFLPTGCRVLGPDMRIRAGRSGIYTYADTVVACGAIQAVDNTLLNPVIIAEVLSDLTEAYDRGKKFAAYREIETLHDYLLISQTEVLVEHFQKQQQGVWQMREYSSLDSALTLERFGIEVALAESYRGVELKA